MKQTVLLATALMIFATYPVKAQYLPEEGHSIQSQAIGKAIVNLTNRKAPAGEYDIPAKPYDNVSKNIIRLFPQGTYTEKRDADSMAGAYALYAQDEWNKAAQKLADLVSQCGKTKVSETKIACDTADLQKARALEQFWKEQYIDRNVEVKVVCALKALVNKEGPVCTFVPSKTEVQREADDKIARAVTDKLAELAKQFPDVQNRFNAYEDELKTEYSKF